MHSEMRATWRLLASLLSLCLAGPVIAQSAADTKAVAAESDSGAVAPAPVPDDQAFLRGMAAKAKKDGARAVQEFSAAAATGHAQAEYLLGLMYLRGDGVKTDLKQAVHWFERALNQAHALAAT